MSNFEDYFNSLLVSQKTDKFIKKELKRAKQKGLITEQEFQGFLNKIENRERIQKEAVSSLEEKFDKYIKEFNPFSISFEERKKIAADIYNNIQERVELYPEDKMRICDLEYKYQTKQISEQEYKKYYKIEVNHDGFLFQAVKSANRLGEITKQLENNKQRYEGFLNTSKEDTTPFSIVRDFENKLYSRIYGISLTWVNDSNNVGSVFFDLKNFSTKNDFIWIRERIKKDSKIFKDFLKKYSQNSTEITFLSKKIDEIANKYTQEVNKIEKERLN